MNAKLLLPAILLALGAAPMPTEAEQTPSEQLAALLDEAWEFELRENPLFATQVGDHRYDDRLGQVAPADYQRRNETRRGFLKRLEAIDRQRLPRPDQINYDIFRRQLTDQLAEYRFRSHLMPITSRSGFHISFPELPRRMRLETVKDFDNYIARLRAFGRYTRQHIELMREGIRQGLVLPAVVLEGYADAIEPHIVDDPADSLLMKPFRHLPEQIAAADRQRLSRAARQAIAQSVVPAYREFLQFMQAEYVPAARRSIGASALPNGRAFYAHRIRRFTTLDVTPDQVHQTGLAEVKRIRAEMEAAVRKSGFEGDFAAFLRYLRTEPKFYATTPEQLLKEVAYVLKRMDGHLPELFGRLPRTPYGIRQVPDYIAPKTTTAYYMPPAGDGSRAGFYYVNTSHLDSRPLYEIEALSLHEAVPGHHLQIALQQELQELPPFRRFSGFTAFVEGWALYAERLGLEVGFYQDPYSDFGRLSYEMWRACRLVVDTGIHHLGWSRQQAIDFMARYTSLSMHNIEAEVDRYISWPGQAVAYKMGELKIRQLRQLAEQELGPRFNLRQFHDVVLGSGSVPLDVLEENVRRYIAARRHPGDQ